jgi:hypothetical protein
MGLLKHCGYPEGKTEMGKVVRELEGHLSLNFAGYGGLEA